MTEDRDSLPVIVLDAGKVLVDFDLRILEKALSALGGDRAVRGLSSGMAQLLEALYRGRRTPDDIRSQINAQCGLAIAAEDWTRLWCGIFVGEIPGMGQALEDLRSEFRLVALSNTDEVHWPFVVEQYPLFKLLDGWVVSYEEALAKPDPAIYRLVEQRYCGGGPPFFHTDDAPEYVRVAQGLGWESAVFRDAASFRAEVARRRLSSSADTTSGPPPRPSSPHRGRCRERR